jgi:quercetin dioxygenase-like cupin family protein
MSKFVMQGEVEIVDYDWGSAGMRVAPPGTGCTTFVVLDVTLAPGGSHAFHKHPDQDELIIVKSGAVTQYIESESRTLRSNDSVYIDKDVVHASYNDSDTDAELQVILAPPAGEGGYETVDVSGEAPWASLR